MSGRVVILLLLCLPAWGGLSILGPVQALDALARGVYRLTGSWALTQIVHPVWLSMWFFFGGMISLVTTPIAVLVALFFMRSAPSPRAWFTYAILGVSAAFGTFLFWAGMGGGMRV